MISGPVLSMVAAGVLLATPSPEQRAQRLMERLDKNGDGKLSRDEFPERMRERFDRFDADKDGAVTLEELKRPRGAGAGRRKRPPLPKPDHANVRYGPHERNVLDLWLAKSEKPAPLVMYFHGGGFRAGDKRTLSLGLLKGLLAEGVSVGAANYRLTNVAPFPAAMHDSARAIQFVRLNAKQYHIDPTRIGATGGSAGAGISLWLALHDDLADPESKDPVLRQSSRLSAAVVYGGQSTYDPRVIAKMFNTNQVHPALPAFYGMGEGADINDPKFAPLYKEASPITHATKDDPPVLLFYNQPDKPLPPNSSGREHIHHPEFGRHMKKKLDALGVKCVVKRREDYEGRPNPTPDYVRFFLEAFGMPAAPGE